MSDAADGPGIAFSLPLPEYAHIPARNARPDGAFLEGVCSLAPATTLADEAARNTAWNYGVRLFNEAYYWECHEVLEAVWMNATPNSLEKHVVQGVIHLANARLKLLMERPKAAERLFGLAQQSLKRLNITIGHRFMGLNITELTEMARIGPHGGQECAIRLIYT